MLARYIQVHDKLLEVVQTERASVLMDTSQSFAIQVKKSSEMLAEINVMTKELQSKGVCYLTVEAQSIYCWMSSTHVD